MNYTKKKSQKQEQRTAKEFGGKVTPASGALDGAKGDVRTMDYLIENKFTDADRYTLSVKTWTKIEEEAVRDGLRTPMMQIDIQDVSLVVIDKYELLEVCTAYKCEHVSTTAKSYTILKDDIDTTHLDVLFLTFTEHNKTLAILGKDQWKNLIDETE